MFTLITAQITYNFNAWLKNTLNVTDDFVFIHTTTSRSFYVFAHSTTSMQSRYAQGYSDVRDVRTIRGYTETKLKSNLNCAGKGVNKMGICPLSQLLLTSHVNGTRNVWFQILQVPCNCNHWIFLKYTYDTYNYKLHWYRILSFVSIIGWTNFDNWQYISLLCRQKFRKHFNILHELVHESCQTIDR